jgi:hypothetical protein
LISTVPPHANCLFRLGKQPPWLSPVKPASISRTHGAVSF